MAVPALDAERAHLSGPEKEDVWVRLTPSPPATFSQAVVLEVKRCQSRPIGPGGGKEASVGEEEGTSSRGCPQPEGGAPPRDQLASSGSTEEEAALPRGQGDGEAVNPLGGSEGSSAVYSPEPAWLPSAAREKAVGASLAPASTEEETCRVGAGGELPLLDTVVMMEHLPLWEGRRPGCGEQEGPGQPCCIPAEDSASGDEPECPICTETYDHDLRRPALLNCNHVLCSRCLRSIMEAAATADFGRVRCPICRQKTPMMEWEICKLQEELLLLNAEPSPALAPPALHFLPVRRPGLWGGLEHHFQMRFHTTRMVGFLPCLRYPPCLVNGLARLERRCRWCYRLSLVALLVAETLSILLVFLPIVLLLLLFLILER